VAKGDHGMPEHAERLAKVRELWLAELSVLRTRGVVAGEPTGLMGPNGYMNVAFDVTACAQFLRANWAAIEGKTLITLAEIEEAEKIADYVAAMAKLRLEAGDAKQRAQALRNKAFTLFLESYEVARRAAMAIRWALFLGAERARGADATSPYELPAHHLVTHGVVVGSRRRPSRAGARARRSTSPHGCAPSRAPRTLLRHDQRAAPRAPRRPSSASRTSTTTSLQTEADRKRLVEGMHLAHGENPTDYDQVLKHLEPRMFLVRNAHHRGPPRLVQPRWAMSYLRGPMTRSELRRAIKR
jgi:hypothetical protein